MFELSAFIIQIRHEPVRSLEKVICPPIWFGSCFTASFALIVGGATSACKPDKMPAKVR